MLPTHYLSSPAYILLGMSWLEGGGRRKRGKKGFFAVFWFLLRGDGEKSDCINWDWGFGIRDLGIPGGATTLLYLLISYLHHLHTMCQLVRFSTNRKTQSQCVNMEQTKGHINTSSCVLTLPYLILLLQTLHTSCLILFAWIALEPIESFTLLLLLPLPEVAPQCHTRCV